MDGLKNTGVLQEMASKVQGPVSLLFWLVMAGMGGMFAVKAVIQGVAYYNAQDERDKKECKGRIINNLIGLLLTLVAGVLLNFLLKNILGIDVLSF